MAPRTGKKMARKPRRKVARRPLRRGPVGRMPKATTGNFASSIETYSGAATAGVVYDFTTKLGNLARTLTIMNAYQYYRITSVEMRFKPQSDTFSAGGSAQIPYLYFQYDKSGSLSGTMNAGSFEEIGTKAIRFDDKTIVRTWKPSVVTGDSASPQTLATQFKVSPWLSTVYNGNLNDNIEHYGACFYISKQNPGDSTTYDVDVILNVQFRKPLVLPAQGVESVSLPIIKQGFTTAVDISLNPHIVG